MANITDQTIRDYVREKHLKSSLSQNQSAHAVGISGEASICWYYATGKACPYADGEKGKSCRFPHPEGQKGCKPNMPKPPNVKEKGATASVKRNRNKKGDKGDDSPDDVKEDKTESIHNAIACKVIEHGKKFVIDGGHCVFWCVLGVCKFKDTTCKAKHDQDKKKSKAGANLKKLLAECTKAVAKVATTTTPSPSLKGVTAAMLMQKIKSNEKFGKAVIAGITNDVLSDPKWVAYTASLAGTKSEEDQ